MGNVQFYSNWIGVPLYIGEILHTLRNNISLYNNIGGHTVK